MLARLDKGSKRSKAYQIDFHRGQNSQVVISHLCKYYSWRKGFVQCYQRQRYYARYYHGFDDRGKLMYYWINTSLEYQATNEHFDCIVVSQNICIRETVKKYILND